MLRSLCGSAPLWQFPYAKMKSDLDRFSICFTDWPQSHGGSEKYLENSAALCLCGKTRTPK